MRSQNAAYLAAAGFGSTGFNNTGSEAMLPNLGRTTRLSFPKTDYTTTDTRSTSGRPSQLFHSHTLSKFL